MTTKFICFTQGARVVVRERFNSLMGLLYDREGLCASFERQAKGKAPGVDGIRKEDYGEGLETRIVELSNRLRRLGSEAIRKCSKDGRSRPETFNFLGFTHFVSRSHRGHIAVGRRTEGKRITKKLKLLNERLRALRVEGGKAMTVYIHQHLRGHIQYYGVSGNLRSLRKYYYFALRLLFKWLNRCSQRRSITWARYWSVMPPWMPRTRIVHSLYPKPG